GRKQEQRSDVDSIGHQPAVESKHADDDRKNQQNSDVGGQKKDDPFHEFALLGGRLDGGPPSWFQDRPGALGFGMERLPFPGKLDADGSMRTFETSAAGSTLRFSRCGAGRGAGSLWKYARPRLSPALNVFTGAMARSAAAARRASRMSRRTRGSSPDLAARAIAVRGPRAQAIERPARQARARSGSTRRCAHWRVA